MVNKIITQKNTPVKLSTYCLVLDKDAKKQVIKSDSIENSKGEYRLLDELVSAGYNYKFFGTGSRTQCYNSRKFETVPREIRQTVGTSLNASVRRTKSKGPKPKRPRLNSPGAPSPTTSPIRRVSTRRSSLPTSLTNSTTRRVSTQRSSLPTSPTTCLPTSPTRRVSTQRSQTPEPRQVSPRRSSTQLRQSDEPEPPQPSTSTRRSRSSSSSSSTVSYRSESSMLRGQLHRDLSAGYVYAMAATRVTTP